jgi:hypothetical protein
MEGVPPEDLSAVGTTDVIMQLSKTSKLKTTHQKL